jgi:ATP-dependent Clp protease ATP-binding subunit ClpC
MLERFTDRARRTMVLSMEEAAGLGHNHLGTEHLLLGLLRGGEGTAAARVLESAGITLDAARREVAEIIGRGEAESSGHIPFTPRAKKVLEISMQESARLGHRYIGTGHVLLGLIVEGDGVAVQVMERLGANMNELRQRAAEGPHDRPEGEEAPGPAPQAAASRPSGEIGSLLGRIEDRLAAIERRLGIGEPPGGEAGIGSAEVNRLRAEVGRLRTVMRQHGIDPG